MKKSLVYIACAALALCGCEDNFKTDKVASGSVISFRAEKVQTKTVYDDDDDLQINWISGQDKVKIYCDEAEDVKEAVYTVSSPATDNIHDKTGANVGTITADGGDEAALKWGGDSGFHTFYAVYPASSAVNVSGGVATCTVNTNQICTITTAGPNYVADPDMNNAYMVSTLSTEPTDIVDLHFKPIMTTLKVTIKAPESVVDQNQAASTITGISLIPTKANYSDTFEYDIEGKKIIANTTTGTRSPILVSVRNADGEAYVDLNPNETLTLTAFIPPVEINAANQYKVRVQGQNIGEYIVTLGGTQGETSKDIAPSSKRNIILPQLDSQVPVGNNWMTPLDDNIYFSQLSVPGTHDAAAYGTSMWNAGQTQSLDIQSQLKMGIRAFDFRPAYNSDKRNDEVMWLYHGTTETNISLNTALTTIETFLTANPGEIVFIQYRHESEKILGSPWSKDTSKWNKIATLLVKHSSFIVPFKGDLTLGECRGKMIMVTRSDFEGRADLGVGLVSGFPDNTAGEASINGTRYVVQDHYKSLGTNSTKKIQDVEDLLDVTAQFHKNSSDYTTWSLNHTSGYSEAFTVFGYEVNLGTSSSYQKNAHYTNPTIFNYLTGKSPSVTTGNMKEDGTTGIMFLDWVGLRRASNYTVYGDLLPQAIIDNNYKYHMARKSN